MSNLNSSLNLRRIRAFIAVAELKSVSEAARRLNMTPPAISKSLRELELSLDASLLHRTPKGMLLSPAGEAFFFRAKLALSELEQGAEDIATLKGMAGNRIVVGALPNGSQPIVPIAVANILKKRPSTRFSIRGGSYDTLVTAVRAGDMELFVGVLPDRDAVGGRRPDRPTGADRATTGGGLASAHRRGRQGGSLPRTAAVRESAPGQSCIATARGWERAIRGTADGGGAGRHRRLRKDGKR